MEFKDNPAYMIECYLYKNYDPIKEKRQLSDFGQSPKKKDHVWHLLRTEEDFSNLIHEDQPQPY